MIGKMVKKLLRGFINIIEYFQYLLCLKTMEYIVQTREIFFPFLTFVTFFKTDFETDIFLALLLIG